MNTFLISFLERAFCRYLAFDPETLKRLATLSGKIIKIELTNWNTAVYLLPNRQGITIKSNSIKKADAEIKGSVFELARMRFTDEKTAAKLARELEIKGDIHLAQTFNQILQQVEVDWEEPLSKVTGDIIAHQIGSLARGLKHWGSQARKSLGLNITEYLQEESRHLPSREEVEDFFCEVSRLQHDLERLEIKLSHNL